MKTPPIRLAFGSVLLRAFLVTAIIMEIVVWNKLQGFLMAKGAGSRIAWLIYFSPAILFQAFLVSSIATVVLDLAVRFVLRLAVGRWYNPVRQGDDFGTPISFQLGSQEKILAEVPARLVEGRHSKPGTMIRTDRRVWFSPFDWSTETWSIDEKSLASLKTVKAPSLWSGLFRGFPDRLVFEDKSGISTQFILADPRAILAWYPPESYAKIPPQTRMPR